MEFTDVVMKRRAVRRFEDGGVDREVIERIARLAQRTPSAGFSQGQRLVVITDPAARLEVARICGEEFYEADFGPWISQCAAQFIPCVSEAIYHLRYQEADKVDENGAEIEWPVPYWWVDIGATMQNIMLAAVNEGLGCGFAGPQIEPLGPTSASRTSSSRSGSCRSGVRCPTCGHPASSEAGRRSMSSRAGSAGAEGARTPLGPESLSYVRHTGTGRWLRRRDRPGDRSASVVRDPDDLFGPRILVVRRDAGQMAKIRASRVGPTDKWRKPEPGWLGEAPRGRPSARGRPRSRRRVDQALAPRLRAAEEAVRGRLPGRDRRQRRRIRPPVRQ